MKGKHTQTAWLQVILILLSAFLIKAAPANIINNWNFEQGSSQYWYFNGDAGVLQGSYPYSGTWYGYVGNANNAVGSLHTYIYVPPNAISATITFYLNIVTLEPSTTTSYDKLDVNLRDGVDDALIRKIVTYAERNKADNVDGHYGLTTISLVAEDLVPCYNKSILLQFYCSTDASNKTIFRIDDVSMVITTQNLPQAPNSLETVAYADHIELYWNDNSDNELGFTIERSVNGGSFSELTGLVANSSYYDDRDVTLCNTYTYRVRAYNEEGNSSYTDEVPNSLIALPSPPTNLSSDGNADSVLLSWRDNSCNELGYIVERKTGANGTWQELARLSTDSVNYPDSSASSGVEYYYKVASYNDVSVSAFTTEVQGIRAPRYTLAISATHGSVVRNPDYSQYVAGARVMLTPTADSEYIFASWNGDISGSGYPIIVTMDRNKNVTASFVMTPSAVRVSYAVGGPGVLETTLSLTSPGFQVMYRVYVLLSYNLGVSWVNYDTFLSQGVPTSTPLPEIQPGQVCLAKLEVSVPKSDDAFMKFPIQGISDPYDVPISAIMDHALGKPGVMRTYMNEEGDPDHPVYSGDEPPLVGFKKDTAGSRFKYNYNYRKPNVIWYDEHTGYDYPASLSDAIVAAASGVLDIKYSAMYEKYNAVCIRHDNGYRTFYLHLSAWTKKLLDARAADIEVRLDQNETIGWAGYAGIKAAEESTDPTPWVHLHLSVWDPELDHVDPYGEYSVTGKNYPFPLWDLTCR